MLGYACINTVLANQNPKVFTSRGMRKKTFLEKGIKECSRLALENIKDFSKIIEWNEKHGIKFFRVSSNIFPWASEYKIKDLPDFKDIRYRLERLGNQIRFWQHRITAHPDHFNKLCSADDRVLKNTIRDLEVHGELFDMMGFASAPYNKINIHIGATYGNKKATQKRFIENFSKLSKSVRSRLTIENDDKSSMWSVKELYPIYEAIGIPIVFDYHHHRFCDGGLSEEEAFRLAYSTWNPFIDPVVHYSESKCDYEDNKSGKPIKSQAHSDYVFKRIKTYGLDNIDIMFEAKAKEQAVLFYSKLHNVPAQKMNFRF